MERDRAQRFQTMAQLRAALLAAAETEDNAPSQEISELCTVPFRPGLEGTTAVDRAVPTRRSEVPTLLTGATLARRPTAPPRRALRLPPSSVLLFVLSITFAVIGLICAYVVAQRIGTS